MPSSPALELPTALGPPVRAPRALMYAYPWDVADEGVDSVAERLHACGIDGVQLAVSYHIASYLLPRNPSRVLYFGDHGALYFQPAAATSRTTGVTPIVSDVLDHPDALAAIVAGLGQAGFVRVAWMVYAYHHALARAQPELAVRGVFGDHSQAQLCTLNPAFRRYALSITEEVLERFAFDGLRVESLSCLPFAYGLLNPKLGVVPSPAAAFLLGVCWCDACTAAGATRGVDATQLAEALRRWLRDHLNGLPGDGDGTPVDVAFEQPFGDDLRKYRETQIEQTTSLHREVLSLAARRGLTVGSTTAEQGLPTRDTGVEISRVASVIDAARIPLEPGVTPGGVAEVERAVRSRLPAVREVYGLLQVDQFASHDSFERAIAAASDAGIRHFRFYNYGLLSETHLRWIAESKGSWA